MSRTTRSSAPYNECLERAEIDVMAALGVRSDEIGEVARGARLLEVDGPALGALDESETPDAIVLAAMCTTSAFSSSSSAGRERYCKLGGSSSQALVRPRYNLAAL